MRKRGLNNKKIIVCFASNFKTFKKILVNKLKIFKNIEFKTNIDTVETNDTIFKYIEFSHQMFGLIIDGYIIIGDPEKITNLDEKIREATIRTGF